MKWSPRLPNLGLGAMLLGVWLAGCSTVAPPTRSLDSPERATRSQIIVNEKLLELVISDMVSAMIQVRELSPYVTTLQYSPPPGDFGQKLLEALELAGYGLQQVTDDQGVNYLAYANRVTENESGTVTDFVISVGGISLRREYDVRDNRVMPASLMYVSGSSSLGNIVLNEDIFLQQGGDLSFENGVELETPDSVIMMSELRGVSQKAGEQAQAINQGSALLLARNNIFVVDQSILLREKEKYAPLRQTELQFEDDTMQLGRGNKAAARILAENFEPATDLIFLSSCASPDGVDSAARASERSSRVKQEFVLLGVPAAAIPEEGCIAEEYPGGRVSDRTVVVMQRRQAEGDAQLAGDRLPLSYPNRPLIMTIPYGAGGATDYQARIATMLAGQESILGQPILIVNKPGLGGRAGWTWFADTATTSGYDLATYNVPHFIAQSIKFETPYNIDTLEPIANWGADPAVLVVPIDSPFQTLRDYILYARANPGKLTATGAGLYVGHHIALLQLEKAGRIKLDYITDTGGTAALKQVVDGKAMSGFNNMSDAFRIRDKIRILAIADRQRHPFIPDVPTFLEQGVDVDDSSVNYRGLMVPKGTDPAIIKRLSAAAMTMFQAPEVVEKMREGGAPVLLLDRAAVQAMWAERQKFLRELLKDL